MKGARIAVTGVTGQVAFPVARALARDNKVFGVARFRDDAARQRVEDAGVTTVVADLSAGDVGAIPADVDYVCNFAVSKTGDWEVDRAVNAEAVGLLMAHARGAKAFLHCSSTAVYQPDGHRHFAEGDALGDNHRAMFATYSLTKIAGEAVAHTFARHLGVPTTIARLNVPYGDGGGWPYFHVLMMKGGMPIAVSDDPPSIYNPIHDDDIVAMLPALLEAAAVPATVVNVGGADVVSIEEWCTYLGELTGLTPTFEESPTALPSVAVDTARLRELAGQPKVGWRDGFKRMVQASFSDLIKQ